MARPIHTYVTCCIHMCDKCAKYTAKYIVFRTHVKHGIRRVMHVWTGCAIYVSKSCHVAICSVRNTVYLQLFHTNKGTRPSLFPLSPSFGLPISSLPLFLHLSLAPSLLCSPYLFLITPLPLAPTHTNNNFLYLLSTPLPLSLTPPPSKEVLVLISIFVMYSFVLLLCVSHTTHTATSLGGRDFETFFQKIPTFCPKKEIRSHM